MICAKPVVLSVIRFVEVAILPAVLVMSPEPVDRLTPPAPEQISVPPVCVIAPVPEA